MNTTHEATVLEPWVVELSKHSMCRGRRSMFRSCCIVFKIRSSCRGFFRYLLRCSYRCSFVNLMFLIERSISFFLYRLWGLVIFTFSGSHHGVVDAVCCG